MKTGSFGLINPSMRYEYKISDAVSSSFSGEWTNATGRYKFRYRRRNTLGEIAYDTTAYRQKYTHDLYPYIVYYAIKDDVLLTLNP